MEGLVQCPVCTLFLHNGMSLESHLDTHPKDQVIKALCSLSANNVGFGSRTSTPMHSERSYRSRSRTPAEDSPRWSARSIDNERYWRRTPSRCSKTPSITRNATPSDVRMADINFENNSNNATSSPYPSISFMKPDKVTQPFVQNVPVPEFDQQYIYYPDQQEDKEIKYSRSAEYSAIDNTNNVFTYNMPSVAPAVKLQSTLLPTASRKTNNLVKILPKPNNILVKANMGGVQYITPGVKPVHLMVPTAPTFVQKNVQNSMIMSGSVPTSQIVAPKSNIASPVVSSNSQFGQLSSGAFTPGTTVVTQNSQIIYREMVHNVDGKPFISSMPTVLGGHENVTNVASTTSMYQNVMVVDQFGNTSCMYTTPQQILSKPCASAPIYSEVSMSTLEKSLPNNMVNESNRTLIIEVSPIVTPAPLEVCTTTSTSQASQTLSELPTETEPPGQEKPVERNDTPGPTKGLKILSNIKVEVPVQHHKNLLNTVVDLTECQEPEYSERSLSPERILPDFEDNNHSLSGDCTQPSATSNDSIVSNTFSVIKNVGNPPSYKDSVSKSRVDNKIENEFSDSCPVPDLICNEKPSISPCSELSESGDNSTDRISISPKPETPPEPPAEPADPPPKPFRCAPLRLNNIFVKKHKKILEIKNCKNLSVTPCGSGDPPENFSMNKIDGSRAETLQTIAVELCRPEFDADTEERSMDLEPVAHCSLVRVKEEGNSGGDLAPLDPARPVNVISYGAMAADDFDDGSDHRELLELEAASKSKRLVSMMNENYFGDNIYADYFTPDRVEAFDAREPPPDDGAYLWGEPSHKPGEFVLPNFIHESYKIADSSAEYAELGRDSKADVLPPASAREAPGDAPSPSPSPSPWPPMYTEVTAAEPYDLIARESWVSDGEEADAADKRDDLSLVEDAGAGARGLTCGTCRAKLPTRAALRAHAAHAHAHAHAAHAHAHAHAAHAHAHGAPAASGSRAPASYSRLVTARAIKKEDKDDVPPVPVSGVLLPDSKEALSSSMLQYEPLDAKPALDVLIKQEPKRRRRDFVCPTCKEDLGSEAAFHLHLKLHPLECLTCGKCFFRRANLALHIKTHLGIKNFKCEVCEKRFLTRQKLMEHHNTHTGRAPYKCTVCDDTFRRYSNMVQHRYLLYRVCEKRFLTRQKLMEHHNTHTGRAPYKCTVCDDTFRRYSNMVQHRYLLYRVCEKRFLTRQKLMEHHNTHTGRAPYKCTVCDDTFRRYSNMVQHRYLLYRVCEKRFLTRQKLMEHHNTHTGRAPYKCTVCDDTFRRYSNMVQHRYLLYRVCEKRFLTRQKLMEHHNTHTGRAPYKCTVCDDTFRRYSNMVQHRYLLYRVCEKRFLTRQKLMEHHNTHTGRAPYKCTVCDDTFRRYSNMVQHRYLLYRVCEKRFLTRQKLMEHHNTHTGRAPYKCTVCDDTFRRYSNMVQHRYLLYRVCEKRFLTRQKLMEHHNTHTGRAPYKCTVCDDTFRRYSNMVQHRYLLYRVCEKRFLTRQKLMEHHNTHTGRAPYKCTVCDDTFRRYSNMVQHRYLLYRVCEKRFLTRQKLMEHHNTHTGRAPYKCTVCDDTFRRYSNMVQHRDRHHLHKKTPVRDFVCQCGAVFHSRAKLRWHRETHADKPQACLYCSDKFVHAASLTRHVRRSHNEHYRDARHRGKADNQTCPVCKQVYLRSNLRAHLLTHSGKRPYACVVCNKAFTTKWNLKLHRWTHMSRSAKPFKCSLCKGAFIRQSEYVSHMNAHKSVRPYTCNYCGCQFIRKYNCQRHVREHETAKKYVCKVPECGKSFHRSYYLSEHMKVHSGARPFACSVCGKLSGNKSNHNKHVKIHHAREPVASEA